MSDPRNIPAEKAAARVLARAARAALDLTVSIESAERIADTLLSLPQLANARTVLAYHAMPEEIDPGPAVRSLRERGTAIVFPRIEAPGVIQLHVVEADTLLLPGPFGLAEPPVDAPLVDPTLIDVAIVPGVAFDAAGRRLGFGGGYYDRLIPRLREDCLVVGVTFDEQVLEQLPTEAHDARVDCVVTPTRVLWAER